MRPEMHQLSVSAVRCDALFVSALQCSEHPDAGQVRRAVAAAVRQYGDCGELVNDRPLRLVPSGRAVVGSQGVGCVLERPAYHKSPPLSVLWSMFLHSGWLHLLGNMLFLVVFGNNIEDRMRKLPFLLFY